MIDEQDKVASLAGKRVSGNQSLLTPARLWWEYNTSSATIYTHVDRTRLWCKLDHTTDHSKICTSMQYKMCKMYKVC